MLAFASERKYVARRELDAANRKLDGAIRGRDWSARALRESGPFDFLRRLTTRRYAPHPDRNQEAYVFSLLAEMVDSGEVPKSELAEEMAANHIRHDSLDLIDRYRGWRLFEQAA